MVTNQLLVCVFAVIYRVFIWKYVIIFQDLVCRFIRETSPPNPLSEGRGGVLVTVRLGMTKWLYQPIGMTRILLPSLWGRGWGRGRLGSWVGCFGLLLLKTPPSPYHLSVVQWDSLERHTAVRRCLSPNSKSWRCWYQRGSDSPHRARYS